MKVNIKDKSERLIEVELRAEHKIMCDDSTVKDNIDMLIDTEIADMLFTSPPYNAGSNELGGNKNLKAKKYKSYNDNLDQDEYRDFLIKFLSLCMNYSKYQFINIQQLSGNKRALYEFMYHFRDSLVDTCIWSKGAGQPAMAKNVMNSRFEFVHIFSIKPNPKRSIEIADFHGTISNVFEFNPSGKNEYKKEHAAVFPLEFVEHFIKNFTQRNTIVLDVFGGTGTTLIACEKHNRECRMMEIDEHYTSIIIERYIRYKGNSDNVFVLRNGELHHYSEVKND